MATKPPTRHNIGDTSNEHNGSGWLGDQLTGPWCSTWDACHGNYLFSRHKKPAVTNRQCATSGTQSVTVLEQRSWRLKAMCFRCSQLRNNRSVHSNVWGAKKRRTAKLRTENGRWKDEINLNKYACIWRAHLAKQQFLARLLKLRK